MSQRHTDLDSRSDENARRRLGSEQVEGETIPAEPFGCNVSTENHTKTATKAGTDPLPTSEKVLRNSCIGVWMCLF